MRSCAIDIADREQWTTTDRNQPASVGERLCLKRATTREVSSLGFRHRFAEIHPGVPVRQWRFDVADRRPRRHPKRGRDQLLWYPPPPLGHLRGRRQEGRNGLHAGMDGLSNTRPFDSDAIETRAEKQRNGMPDAAAET